MLDIETQPTRGDFYAELLKFLQSKEFDSSNEDLVELFEATQPSISRSDLHAIHMNSDHILRLRVMAAAYRDLYTSNFNNDCLTGLFVLKGLHELLAHDYPYFVWMAVTDELELELSDSIGAKASMIMENTPGGIFEEYFLNPNNFELFAEKDLQQGVWIKRR
ncbi:MAG: hypothetical protein V4686_00950 [Patescibacteria group bacterium]